MARVRHAWLEERRLEQPRVEVAHHLRGADRREVGRSLVAALRAERVAEREQEQRRPRAATRDGGEHHQRRLAASQLAAEAASRLLLAAGRPARRSRGPARRAPRGLRARAGRPVASSGSANRPGWSCGARFSTTIGVGPDARDALRAPLAPAPAPRRGVVTITVRSATEAGAPPSASEPGVDDERSVVAGRAGRARSGSAPPTRQRRPTARGCAPGTSSSARASRAAACVASGIPAGRRLARTRPPRPAGSRSGQLSRERACDDRDAAATREPEDAHDRAACSTGPAPSAAGSGAAGSRKKDSTRGGGRREECRGAAAARRRRLDARLRPHGASTAALRRHLEPPASARSSVGGRSRTVTSPPATDTRPRARDQPGRAARAAARASPPPASASAPASAAFPASTLA